MSFKGKREYLQAIRKRYQLGSKNVKSQILNEFCEVCKYSRKYAIRILSGKVNPREKKPGPKKKYGDELVQHLIYLYESMDRVCSKKMVAALPLWLPYYKHPDFTPKIKKQLLEVSSSTIDRLLREYKQGPNKGISTTKPNYFIKSKIPIELLHSKVKEPGFIEADTVAHCGNSIAGKYANTITMTDLSTGWTENRATWTKDADNVLKKIDSIIDELPFITRGFACDNGTEFLNKQLYQYFKNYKPAPIKFVRRRPYKKNDNAHVEQKNWTHVRQLFGYDRLDEIELIPLMNEIYRAYWNPLHNYFIPNMKLVKKERIGGRVKKTYDTPKTPFQRIIESSSVYSGQKEKLRVNISWLNPFTLKNELDKKLKYFRRLVEINNYNKLINDKLA